MEPSTESETPMPGTPRLRRKVQATAVAAAAALALTSCSLFGDSGGGGGGGGEGGEADGGSITVQATNFAHIDPQSITFGMWLVQMGLLEGLVLQTPDGTDVRPGVADEWEVSEDGLTYTFHLRDGVTWSNGEPLTAADFEWTYQRLLDPARGDSGVTTGASSYQVPLGILNAEEYNTGVVTDYDEVGIEAVDDQTLEFTLAAPNPGFVMGLTYPSMLPLNPDAVEGEGDWQQPENWVGNGPYNLAAWTANSSMRLEKNPEYWDAENVALDEINVQLIEQGSITTTVPYENGEVDIQGLGEPAEITRFLADPVLSEQMYVLENSGTAYLAPLHSSNPIIEDPNIRRALNLGLGREEIAGISEMTAPASTLTSPIVPGWSEDMAAHDAMWGEDAVAEAQQLLADAGYPDGEGFPTLTILAGSDFPQLDAIIDTWETNLGIQAVKDVVEVGVYVERRYEMHDDGYVGFWYGSFSGISTWPYQVEQLWSPDMIRQAGLDGASYEQFLAVQNDEAMSPGDRTAQIEEILSTGTMPEAQAFAERVAETRETSDEAEQQEIFFDAASLREDTELLLPVAWNHVVYVAQPRVQGLEIRAQADRYYFKDLWVDDSAE
ncbi:4-phytase [Beutenbergia cavernae DSM 12333]|uniref:4-phytase n=1 Tax=Beutenbergia cavernae (strain ATCC BAA-8 / DSM 12333 / CCUG 43141 / JCM 11478 / NBRC 16432 / NCIMB 13614 / HKI 0122) TaxID=471853 RepID=C5C1H3_BEUC1|nr:peptide ABC transporter substrate-binding protein [Beutenbergia cavernae]ACQ81583.1 4-phytase [Beutenbergia cavernae DSM 12333]